jgi:hypothetical protein
MPLVIAATPAPPVPLPAALPAELRPLAATLQQRGFQVRLARPPVANAYGLFQAKTRTLWIAPVAFDLGIGRQVFVHEAIHAAQSCPNGVLRPLGWSVALNPVVEQEISGILTTRYHHGNRQLEREAFSLQGHPDAIGRVIAALKQRCRLAAPSRGANRTKP